MAAFANRSAVRTAPFVRTVAAALFAFGMAGSAFGLTFSDRFRSPRNPERRVRSSTTLVVLHTTEAGARSSLNKLCERGECHYCVPENGTVYRIVDRERVAFHAGRSMWNGQEECDNFSVGIEVVGHHDEPLTLKQLDALKELLAWLKQIYKLTDAQIVTHSQVAYGAPNKWQKKNHRGRKRCGMLFAMASVRAKMGLSARPKYDPDVRARRLVQADPYLNSVLYGKVDTMASRIGKPDPAPSKGILAGVKTWFGGASKTDKPKAETAKTPEKPAPPKQVAKPPPEKKVVVSTPAPPKTVVKAVPAGTVQKTAFPKTLAELHALKTHKLAGVVDAKHSASKLAGKAWNGATTYYFTRGKVVTGDKVDARRLEKGACVYVKK